MPVCRGLFCYRLFLFFGRLLFFLPVPRGPFYFISNPFSCCDSGGIVMLELVRNTDIVVITVKGQFMGPKPLYEVLLL